MKLLTTGFISLLGMASGFAHADSHCIDVKRNAISYFVLEPAKSAPCLRLVFHNSPNLLAYIVQLPPNLAAGIQILDANLSPTSSVEADENGMVAKSVSNPGKESIFKLNLKKPVSKPEKVSVTAVEFEDKASVYINLE